MDPRDFIAKCTDTAAQTTYFLFQEGNNLVERVDDGDLGAPERVGVAKPLTGAAYLLSQDEKRAIFCLTEDNTIQDFVWDPDAWKWSEGGIRQLAIPATPDTEFCAIEYEPTHKEVFFQGPSGSIQSLYTLDGEQWLLSSHLPKTSPSIGASLCCLRVGRLTHVFYSHQTHSIHVLTFDDKAWLDQPVAESSCKSNIRGIWAQPQGSSYLLQFGDTEGSIFLLSDGHVTKWGRIENGRLKKDKDAQSDRHPDPVESDPKFKGMKLR